MVDNSRTIFLRCNGAREYSKNISTTKFFTFTVLYSVVNSELYSSVRNGDWQRRISTGVDGSRGWNSAIERRSLVWIQSLVLFPLPLSCGVHYYITVSNQLTNTQWKYCIVSGLQAVRVMSIAQQMDKCILQCCYIKWYGKWLYMCVLILLYVHVNIALSLL